MPVISVAMMLNAIHAQESKEVAKEKVEQIAEKLKEMKLSATAKNCKIEMTRPLPIWTSPPSTEAASEPTTQ